MYFISLRERSATDVNTPRSITSRWIFANQISTWFNRDEYVGVKWKRTRGFSSRNSATVFSFVCRKIIEDDRDFFRVRCSFDDICQESKELFAGVTTSRFAVHLSRLHVQRSVE